MKKKTNIQTVPEAAQPKPHRTGPPKEKAQVTLRLDMELMAAVNSQIKEDNTRITDFIEQALLFALEKSRYEIPAWTQKIRFVLANATREQQTLLRGVAIAMVADQVAELSAAERKALEYCRWVYESYNRVEYAKEALGYYSRYGRSADEIAKLGS